MASEKNSRIFIAPGKVILHGEHAVVYGIKAIAVSVSLYTTFKIKPSQKFSLKFNDIGIDSSFTLEEIQQLKSSLGNDFCYETINQQNPIEISEKVVETLEDFIKKNIKFLPCNEALKSSQSAAFLSFLFMYLAIIDNLEPFEFSIETDLPVGAGLGSSASFAVVLAGGFLSIANRIDSISIDLNLVNKWAFVSEKLVHGNPSGVDNSVATFGGAVVFQKGKELELIDTPTFRVILVNTKIPRSTKQLVANVAQLKEDRPDFFKDQMNQIISLIETVIELLKSKNPLKEELIEKNQNILKNLNVSHPALDDIVATAKKFTLAAKLTGAGGGGCAFILVPNDYNKDTAEELKSELNHKGYETWETYLGGDGFQIK